MRRLRIFCFPFFFILGKHDLELEMSPIPVWNRHKERGHEDGGYKRVCAGDRNGV